MVTHKKAADSTLASKLKREFSETLDSEWRIRNAAKNERYDDWVNNIPPVTDYPKLRKLLYEGYCSVIDNCEIFHNGHITKDELAVYNSASMSKLYHALAKETAKLDTKYGVNPFQLWRPVYWDAIQDYQQATSLGVAHTQNEIHIR